MSSLHEFINDMSKFLKLPSDPTIGIEGKLQKLLCTLNKKAFFSKEKYENIYPSDSQLARLYSNPKSDKLKSESEKLTFRPIVSFIGAYNYKPVTFLRNMLNSIIPKDHCYEDSFLFCKEIKKVSSTNMFLISHNIYGLLLAFLSTKQLT